MHIFFISISYYISRCACLSEQQECKTPGHVFNKWIFLSLCSMRLYFWLDFSSSLNSLPCHYWSLHIYISLKFPLKFSGSLVAANAKTKAQPKIVGTRCWLGSLFYKNYLNLNLYKFKLNRIQLIAKTRVVFGTQRPVFALAPLLLWSPAPQVSSIICS